MITYRQVKLAETQTVIESFLAEQWAHTGDKDLKCKPNWAVYLSLEKVGSLLLLIAYDDERPVGYLAGFVHPHLNALDSVVATIPTYFVEERAGRAFIMRTMLEQAVSALLDRGCVHINIETEYEHSAGKLLQKLGFRPSKIGYKLRLVKEPAHA